MDNQLTAQIELIIQKGLEEKTFSLEIIEHIKKLKDDFQNALNNVESLTKQLKSCDEERYRLNNDLAAATQRLDVFIAREAKLVEREKNAEKLAYQLTFQTQRADEIKELFGTVFRNPTILRSKMINNVVPGTNNSYPSTMTTNDTESETII